MSLSQAQIEGIKKEEGYWTAWESGKGFEVVDREFARFVGERRIAQLYGTRVAVDNVTADKKGHWVLGLRATFPRTIEDDLTGRTITRFLQLPTIGSIKIDRRGNTLDAQDRPALAQVVSDRLVAWNHRIEAIIVNATASKLVKIPEVRVAMNKFAMILKELYDEPAIALAQLEGQIFPEGGDKMNRYISLMEDLDLVRRHDEDLTYGTVFQGLYEKSRHDHSEKRSLEDFQRLGLAYVLGERHSLLKDYLGLTTIDPFVNAEACIYRPSIEARQPINVSEYRIENEFLRMATPTLAYFRNYLDRLIAVKAIVRVGDRIYAGAKPLLQTMLVRADQLGITQMRVDI